jgi:hypothetical protein
MEVNSTANARLKVVFMGATYSTFFQGSQRAPGKQQCVSRMTIRLEDAPAVQHKILSHEEKIQGVVFLVATFPNRKNSLFYERNCLTGDHGVVG